MLIGIPPARLPEQDRKAAMQAIAAYQSSLFARADYPETQMQIAGLAMTLRNFNVAQGALKEALSMDPQLADAWLMLARIQTALRRPEQAMATLESAAKAAPDNGNVLLQLGVLYLQQRQYRQAVAALAEAVEQTGSSPELLDMLAVSHLGAGNLENAREVANRLVQEFPQHRPSELLSRILRMPK